MTKKGEPEELRISAIYPTIQGEGKLSGTPMILCRLQGCHVGCDYCDTKETWPARLEAERQVSIEDVSCTSPSRNWAAAEPFHVAAECKRRALGERWVLITGGEPLEQSLVSTLVMRLHGFGYRVALETSGTRPYPAPFPANRLNAKAHELALWPDHICVSPKPRRKVNETLLELAHEVKLVVTSEQDLKRYTERWRKDASRVWLQPEWSVRARVMPHILEACAMWGFNLSVQTHKLLGIP